MAIPAASFLATTAALAWLGVVAALRSPESLDRSRAAVLADEQLAITQEFMKHTDSVSISRKLRVKYMGPDRGVGLVALEPIAKGEELMTGVITPSDAIRADMRHPWESDEFEAFVGKFSNESAKAISAGTPGMGALMLKLTNLFLQAGHREAAELSALERYVATSTPLVGPCYQWPADVRALLSGSVFLTLSEEMIEDDRQTAKMLLDAWPWSIPTPSLDEFMEAWLKARAVILTRSFDDSTYGRKLVPVLDLLNHGSAPSDNAEYYFTDIAADFFADFEGVPAWVVEAKADIQPDDEILVAYLQAFTFLDMWVYYGFFDESSTKHEVRIMVQAPELHGVFSVPDESWLLEDSELFKELRAYAKRHLGLRKVGEVRQYALQRMREFIAAHLAGYPAGAAAPAKDRRRGAADGDRWEEARAAARRVVRYEQERLRRALAHMDELMEDGPAIAVPAMGGASLPSKQHAAAAAKGEGPGAKKKARRKRGKR